MTSGGVELSTLARYNECLKYADFFLSDNCVEEFFRFATNQEECRLKWLESENEKRRLTSALDAAKKEIASLEYKLTMSRRLIDQEKAQIKSVEEERKALERQLQTVRDVLLTDERNKLHDETKEKLKFLNSTMNSRRSTDFFGRSNDHLSIIPELESTGSVLSDLSYSGTDNDLDVSSMKSESNRRYGKHRRSQPTEELINVKRRRSSINRNNEILKVKSKDNEQMVATTTVRVDLDGSISARSQIEALPSLRSQLAPTESIESGLSVGNNNAANQMTPSTLSTYPNPMSSTNLNVRQHHLVSKTMLRSESCDVCCKRLKFGSTIMRCQNCKTICHMACKDKLPLPCIQPGNTPTTKGVMGCIADYTPMMAPMVPSLVVHCANEVEARGLDEIGIYRVPGSDKEVKALKEKFLRGKGVPNLSLITDIHIICGCLKEFLRSLREPLVTYSLWWKFVSAAGVKDEEMRRAKLIQVIVSDLAQPNRDTLAFVILHLQRVAEFKEVNKMPINNLARVFAPTIVGYSQSNPETKQIYAETRQATEVMEEFLNISSEYWANIMSAPQDIEHTPTSQNIVGNTLSRGFLSTPHGIRSLRSKKNFFTPGY